LGTYGEDFAGFDEWRRKLYELTPYIDAQVEDIYSRGADLMVQTAQSLCPVEADAPFRRPPGTLRDSIRKDIGQDGDRTVTRVLEGDSTAFYGTFVEFGRGVAYKTASGRRRRARRTRSAVPPHPHYFPAYEVAKTWIFEQLAAIQPAPEQLSRASKIYHALTFPLSFLRAAREL